MPIIKVLGTQKIFLSDPSISTMKTIRAKNIFHQKASGGIIIDNYRAMKFFIDRVFLIKSKKIKDLDIDLLWDITDMKEHKTIWDEVSRPIIPSFFKDESAQEKIINLYIKKTKPKSQRDKKEFEKRRSVGTMLYKLDCFGKILTYEVIKEMETMYEAKCTNREKENIRKHFRQKEYWYTKTGIIIEAKNRLRIIQKEIENFEK